MMSVSAHGGLVHVFIYECKILDNRRYKISCEELSQTDGIIFVCYITHRKLWCHIKERILQQKIFYYNEDLRDVLYQQGIYRSFPNWKDIGNFDIKSFAFYSIVFVTYKCDGLYVLQ